MAYSKGDWVIYRGRKKMIKENSAFVNGVTYYKLVGSPNSVSERELTPYAEITASDLRRRRAPRRTSLFGLNFGKSVRFG